MGSSQPGAEQVDGHAETLTRKFGVAEGADIAQEGVLGVEFVPGEVDISVAQCVVDKSAAIAGWCVSWRTQSIISSALISAARYGVNLAEQHKYAEAEQPLLEGYRWLLKADMQKVDRTRYVVQKIIETYEALQKPDDLAKWQNELQNLQAATQPSTGAATQATG